MRSWRRLAEGRTAQKPFHGQTNMARLCISSSMNARLIGLLPRRNRERLSIARCNGEENALMGPKLSTLLSSAPASWGQLILQAQVSTF